MILSGRTVHRGRQWGRSRRWSGRPGEPWVRAGADGVSAERQGREKNTNLSGDAEGDDTMGKKSKAKKKRLSKLERQNSRVPAWVIMKTDRDTLRNHKRRNWRRNDTDE